MRRSFLNQFFGSNEEATVSGQTSMAFIRLKIHEELTEAIDRGDLAEVNNLLRAHFARRNDAQEDMDLGAMKHRYLRQALGKNQLRIFYSLMDQGAPVGGENSGEATFLHYAAEIGNGQLVERLLMKDVDALAVNPANETPLHVAVKRNNVEIVHMLLDYLMESPEQNSKLESNLADNDGISLFHVLCMGPHSYHAEDFLENVSVRIDERVSSDTRFFPGYDALHFAAAYYRCDTVKVLLEHGADVNSVTKTGLTALHLACTLNNVKEIVHEAVTNMPMCLNDADRRSLCFENLKAGLNKRYELIKALLSKNCDVDARDGDGNNALMCVMLNSYLDMELSMKSSNITDDHVNDLIRRSEIVELLEDQQLSIVRLLLQHYNDNNLADSDLDSDEVRFDEPLNGLDLTNDVGHTPLHHLAAIPNSSARVVRFLLKCGADPNAVDQNFQTPLHVASKNENLGYINAVLDGKGSTKLDNMANVNAQDSKGHTPIRLLQITTKTENVQRLNECFCSLLKSGADIHVESEDGSSEFTAICNSVLQIISTSDFPSILLGHRKNDDSINVNSHRLYVDGDAKTSGLSVETVDAIWKRLEMLRACDGCEYGGNVKLHLYCLRRISSKLHTSRRSIDDCMDFAASCKQEVDKMAQIRVNKYICLSDVLSKSIDKVAAYAEIDELRSTLESSDFEVQFPIYGKMLKARFVRGLNRKNLLEEATSSLKWLLRWDMPQPCIERILSYSSDKMLRDVIETKSISDEKERDGQTISVKYYFLYPKTTKIS